MSLGWNDAFIWGGEYKQFKESYYSSTISAFADPTTTISLENIFAQDEIPLLPDLRLTLGLKAENNSYSGLDLMPNVRLAWQITDSGMIWAAVSQSGAHAVQGGPRTGRARNRAAVAQFRIGEAHRL